MLRRDVLPLFFRKRRRKGKFYQKMEAKGYGKTVGQQLQDCLMTS
jgi:hypothetical protein